MILQVPTKLILPFLFFLYAQNVWQAWQECQNRLLTLVYNTNTLSQTTLFCDTAWQVWQELFLLAERLGFCNLSKQKCYIYLSRDFQLVWFEDILLECQKNLTN